MFLLQHQHISHPLPTSLFLLLTLPGKCWECFNLSAVNGRLDNAADPGLILLGTAQGGCCDGVHVSLVLHVQPDYILPLLIRAFILLLKFEDILHCNLRDGQKDKASCQDTEKHNKCYCTVLMMLEN